VFVAFTETPLVTEQFKDVRHAASLNGKQVNSAGVPDV